MSKNKEKLCFVGGAAAQAVCSTLIENGLAPEKLAVVSSLSWLEKMDSSWDNMPWGQNINCLPPSMLHIAKQFFPTYPEAERMTAGMMKQIVKEQRRLLSAKVATLHDKIDLITEENHGLSYHIGNIKHKLLNTPNFHIFNSARIPRPSEIRDAQNMANAYVHSRSYYEGKLIAVIGSGLNIDGALRDFPLSHVIHLIPKGNRERPDLTKEVYAAFKMEELKYEKFADGTMIIEGMNINNGKTMKVRLQQGHVYLATGYMIDSHFIQVNPGKITIADGSPNLKAIEYSYSFHDDIPIIKVNDRRGTKIPDGSLNYCYHKILSVALNYLGKSELYPLDNAYALMCMDGWQNALELKAKRAGININPHLYEILFTRIKYCLTDNIPAEKQLWYAIQCAFKQGVIGPSGVQTPAGSSADGTAISWDQFINLLKQDKDKKLFHSKNASLTLSSHLFNKPTINLPSPTRKVFANITFRNTPHLWKSLTGMPKSASNTTFYSFASKALKIFKLK